MGLIYVKTLRQAPERKNSSAARPSAGTAPETTSAEQAFALRALAKLLDALLQFILVAGTKILRAALRAADAHRFRWGVRSRAI